MKPTPGELVRAVRDALRPAGAELASPEARASLRRALYVLREGRWEDAAFDLLAENEALAGAVDRVGAFLGEDVTSPEADLPRSFAQANDRNLDLRTQLAVLLDRLGDRDLAESAELRAGIAVLLRGPR